MGVGSQTANGEENSARPEVELETSSPRASGNRAGSKATWRPRLPAGPPAPPARPAPPAGGPRRSPSPSAPPHRADFRFPSRRAGGAAASGPRRPPRPQGRSGGPGAAAGGSRAREAGLEGRAAADVGVKRPPPPPSQSREQAAEREEDAVVSAARSGARGLRGTCREGAGSGRASSPGLCDLPGRRGSGVPGPTRAAHVPGDPAGAPFLRSALDFPVDPRAPRPPARCGHRPGKVVLLCSASRVTQPPGSARRRAGRRRLTLWADRDPEPPKRELRSRLLSGETGLHPCAMGRPSLGALMAGGLPSPQLRPEAGIFPKL
ncbi:collagen alpha-1(I) chain-like [Bubalus kerabau]|uniref:collagen alpha-1(I) chain-like n=1 Tax=Bubalus carabanensis TaxID=3119969 RepID=UPI00244EBB93|nr:collagen alpha-1(I) chain-like [Bubalus carabanensis]